MNQFAQADDLVLFWCASGSNYVRLVHLQVVDFSNLYFWPLTSGAAVPFSGRLACFRGRAKHILYILGFRDLPLQLSSKQADWPWNLGTMMICLTVGAESVLLSCRQNAALSSSWLKVHSSDFTFTLISQQLLHFCLSPQSVRSDHGL